MKKFILLLLTALASPCIYAQPVSYSWASSAGEFYPSDESRSIATDQNGNIFITGNFPGYGFNLGSVTLVNPNAGYNAVFIAKTDSAGAVLWARTGSGAGDAYGNSVATDAAGNVYITGYYSSPSISFGTVTVTNLGNRDLFLAKYDAAGNLLWLRNFGGSGADYGFAVSTDITGNVLLTGYFQSPSVVFGPFVLLNSNPGSADAFVVKLDSSGNVLWANGIGTVANDYGWNIAGDPQGNVLVAGYFSGASIIIGADTLLNTGVEDLFIIKYDPSGTVLWAKGQGGIDSDRPGGICADASGNVIVTGNFGSASVTLGATTLNNVSLSGYRDLFLFKYDAGGTLIWAKSAGGSEDDIPQGVSTSPAGNIFITGYFRSLDLSFGSVVLSSTYSGTIDIFTCEYDTTGNFIAAEKMGGPGNDFGWGIARSVTGNVLITGFYESFSMTAGATTLTNAGPGNIRDLFICSMNFPPDTVSIPDTSLCFAYYLTSYDSTLNTFYLDVDPLTLDSSVSFHWDFGDGASSSLATPSHVYTADSVYNVCMTAYRSSGDSCSYCHLVGIDSAGNTVRDAGFTIYVHAVSTGIPTLSSGDDVSIYPNPNNGSCMLTASENITKICVMDISGRTVYADSPLHSNSVAIDLSRHSDGIYFVFVTTPSAVNIRKMCISK